MSDHESIVSPPTVREEAERWMPGAEAAHRDDLARDVAHRWVKTEFENLQMPLSLAEALDRLAVSYGFPSRWEEDE